MAAPVIIGYPDEIYSYEYYYGSRIPVLQKRAEQGDKKAQFQLARCYRLGMNVEKDHEKAVEWYTKAAEQGDPWAQIELGNIYYFGDCVEKDYLKAVEWYTKAAKQERSWGLGQYKLGVCYFNGEGITQDYKKAIKLFLKAAENGYGDGRIKAQIALGYCYKNGEGVRKNLKKAIEWYTKAAKLDNAKAQYILAKCYEDGIGVEKNIIKAKIWYRKAYCNPEAQQALKNLLSNPAYVEILKKHKKDLKEYKNKAGEFYRQHCMANKWLSDFSEEENEKYYQYFRQKYINGQHTKLNFIEAFNKQLIKDFEEYKNKADEYHQKRYSMSTRMMRKWVLETSDEKWEEYMQDFEPSMAVLEILEYQEACRCV